MAVPSGILTAGARWGGAAVATYDFLSTGWATFGLALPQGAATGGVKVGALSTQTDVKTVWTDGSIRHCVVTADIDAIGTKAITAFTASSGSLVPTWPSASVAFTIGADTYTATLPSLTTSNPWLTAGALAREYRVIVKPSNGGTDHAFLEVYFDVRSYLGGGHRIDISVENCLNVAAANSVTYNVAIVVDGSAVFSQDSVVHYYTQRWRKYYPVGLTEATWTPDLTPFYTSNMIPEYADDMTTVSRTIPTAILSLAGNYGGGNYPANMMGTGAREEIYFFPSWVTEYLVHKTQDLLLNMLRRADTTWPTYGVHIHETTGLLPSIYAKTNFKLSVAGGGTTGPAGTGRPATQVMETDNAHLTDVAFVPYLITGDRFFLDETKYWANTGVIGRGMVNMTDQQTRGFGWALRSVAECAAACPDADPEKAYFTNITLANQTYENAHQQLWDDPLGFTETYYVHGNAPSAFMGPWQQTYRLYGLWIARRLGFNATGGAAAELRLRNEIISFFMHEADGFPRDHAAAYYVRHRRYDDSRFTTWQEFFDYNFVDDNNDYAASGWPATYYPIFVYPAGGYFLDLRFALLCGKAHGVAGCEDALSWMEAYTGYPPVSGYSTLHRLQTSNTQGHQYYLKEFVDVGPGA